MSNNENNPIVEAQMEEDKNNIFKLAHNYFKFSEELKNSDKNNKNNKDKKNGNIVVYIIPKEFTDNFKEKINYEQSKQYLNDEKNEENKKKFKEFLNKYTYDELYSILCADIKLYCDLTEIQTDLSKGFDFVNYPFLDLLDFEGANFDDYISYYYRENNNILIEFDDKSKLIINDIDGEKKYHAMDGPIEKVDTIQPIKRTKTVAGAYFSNKRSRTLKANNMLKKKSKTVDEKKASQK